MSIRLETIQVGPLGENVYLVQSSTRATRPNESWTYYIPAGYAPSSLC